MATVHPLRAYRDKHGISVRELADRIGVSRTTVFRWESGEREIDRKLWSVVSDVTGLPVADVAGFERAAPSPAEATP